MADANHAPAANPLSQTRGGFFVVLFALLLVASFSLRLYGLNWDEGRRLHPDEVGITTAALEHVGWPPGTTITSLFDPTTSPLNPRAAGAAYPYGTLPLYLGKIAASLFSAGDYQGILLTGRAISALFDTATLLLLFLVASLIWGRWWGLFAASLYGLAILPLQLSHFYISEPFMTFFMAAVLLGSLLYLQSGRLPALMLAGLCCGLAMSCKLSAAPVLALPVATILSRHAVQEGDTRLSFSNVTRLLAVTLAVSLAGLCIGDPYALLDAPNYLKQVADQAAIQSGAADVWFTRRYVGTWPIIYPLWQLLLLGIGPLVGIFSIAGITIAAVRIRREPKYIMLLAGFLAWFASIAFLEAKWVRYLLPLVPYVCLFATLAVMKLLQWRPITQRTVLRWSISGVVIASTAVGALALTSVYAQEHPAIEATRWLYSNVTPGARIATEINDGPLPLPLADHHNPEREYAITRLRMLADFPSPEASTYLRDGLRTTDYLVVGSTRGTRTVPAMPWRYPVQEQYYRLLFAGKLGFLPIYTASSYPTILGLTFPDDNDWIDPSFTEYDHPTFRVFKKNRDLSDTEWDTLFADAAKKPSVATRHAR